MESKAIVGKPNTTTLPTACAPILVIGKAGLKTPVSVISFLVVGDNIVAYDKERGKSATYSGMPSAMEPAAFFAKQHGCAKKSERTEVSKG